MIPGAPARSQTSLCITPAMPSRRYTPYALRRTARRPPPPAARFASECISNSFNLPHTLPYLPARPLQRPRSDDSRCCAGPSRCHRAHLPHNEPADGQRGVHQVRSLRRLLRPLPLHMPTRSLPSARTPVHLRAPSRAPCCIPCGSPSSSASQARRFPHDCADPPVVPRPYA